MPEKQKVPMKWAIRVMGNEGQAIAFLTALVLSFPVAFAVAEWVRHGGSALGSDAVVHRAAVVWSVLTLAWCLAFVRRVPR